MLEILVNTGPVLAHEVLNLILDQKNQTDWIWEHGRNQMVQTLRREISWRLFDALSDQEKTMVAQDPNSCIPGCPECKWTWSISIRWCLH